MLWFLTLLGSLAALIGAGVTYQRVADRRDRGTFPPNYRGLAFGK